MRPARVCTFQLVEPGGPIIKVFPLQILRRRVARPEPPGGASDRGLCTLLLPATAERLVKLHETLILGAARSREREFGGKQRPLPVQDFQISGGATFITHIG